MFRRVIVVLVGFEGPINYGKGMRYIYYFSLKLAKMMYSTCLIGLRLQKQKNEERFKWIGFVGLHNCIIMYISLKYRITEITNFSAIHVMLRI